MSTTAEEIHLRIAGDTEFGSIAGNLNRHELERFNNHFLTAPERKRKLRFGQRFRGVVDASQPVIVSERVSKPAFTFRDIFRYQLSFGYAAVGLLVLLVGGGLWADLSFQEMQRRIDAATTQLASERESFQKRLDESQAKLQSDFRALDQAVANLKSSAAPEGLLAFALMPGLTRSPTDVQKISLTPKSQLVEFSLTLVHSLLAAMKCFAVVRHNWLKTPNSQKRGSPFGGHMKRIQILAAAVALISLAAPHAVEAAEWISNKTATRLRFAARRRL